MDLIYRYQLRFYDATRRLFLFGRNGLLESDRPRTGDTVLEMGCGTGRNLIMLARKYESVNFYGVDASSAMIGFAGGRVEKASLSDRIQLAHCLAEDLDHQKTFGKDQPFDSVFFSYSLTMMPKWRDALTAAIRNLATTGSLHVVDFWDQRRWPGFLRTAIKKWLSLFRVRFDSKMINALEEYSFRPGSKLTLKSILRDYAFSASLTSVPLMENDPK